MVRSPRRGPPRREVGADGERAGCTAAVIGDHLYVVGGRLPNGGFTGGIEAAKIDGASISAFAVQPQLVNAGAEHKVWAPSVAGGGGFFFVAGGRTNYQSLQ